MRDSRESEGDTIPLSLYRCGMGYNSRSYKRARAQAQAQVNGGEAWCRVCGQPITPKGRGKGVGGKGVGGKGIGGRGSSSWSIDHVVPLALGGGDEPANLRLVHARCNSSLGGKLGGRMRTRKRTHERSNKFMGRG